MKRFFCVLLVLLLCVPAMAEGDSAGEAVPVVKYDIATNHYGYADARGRYITEPIYESAKPFSCEYGLAETEDAYFYINTDGEVAAEFAKQDLSIWCYSFSEGIAIYSQPDLMTAFDTDFQVVFQLKRQEDGVRRRLVDDYFSEGYLCVWLEDAYSYLSEGFEFYDKTGQVVYKGEGYARGFSCGLAMVEREDERVVYLNSSFEEAIVLEEGARGSDFSEGLALVHDSDGYGYIDTEGNEAFGSHVRFDYARDFSCGYAVVSVDGLYGYIGRDGEWATEQRFAQAWAFASAGVAEVTYADTGEMYLIDTDFQPIAPYEDPQWDLAKFIYDNNTLLTGGEIYRRGEDGKFHHAQQVLTDFDRERYYAFTGDLVPELGKEASLRFGEGDELPRVDGATALIPMYNGFVQAVYPESVRFTALSGDVMEPETGSTQLTCTKSSQIFSRLAAGLCDIIFSAYPSDDQAAEAMDEYGATFHYTPIAREAFVFFVNPDNPVDNLSLDDIRGIYSGEITDWSELGVSGIGSIAPFQRNRGSGSQTALERLMEGDTLMQAPASFIYGDMGGIVEEIALGYENTENAIGYSVRFYVTGLMQADVKLLSIDGVAPTPENIRSGAYPCVIDLYAVTREGEESPSVARFLGWLQTDEAREITEKSGYVAIEP